MVAAMLGAMLLLFGRQENIPALKWWGTAYLLGAASVALWTLASPMLGDLLSLALNGVGFVACGMVWNASRVFHGRKPNLPGLVLGAIAWIAAVMTLAPAASALRKIVLLLLADALLNWSTGTLLGLDFFGFAAVSTATLFGVRRARRPERVAGVLLALVLIARFGLAPVVHGRIPDDSLLAFVTGNAAVHHISYPLGPWLAFPLLGFLIGRRWRQAGSSQEAWIVGVTAASCLALSALLAACGAPVFRWSSVSIAYFLCAVGIVAAAWLLADRAVVALPAMAQRTSLRGPASLLIVPLHYGILGVLETLSPPPWDAAAWAPVTIALVLVVFVLSRTLVSNARRLAVPGPFVQAAIAAVAAVAGLVAWREAPALPRLEVCSAGQVVIALLLLWSSNKRGSSQRAGSDDPTRHRT